MNRHTKVLTMAAAIIAVSSAAYAAHGSLPNDAMAITKAKIPLAEAVTTAERHANGKATRAEYENSKQGWVYEVEVVSGAKVFDVKVDGSKGTVISSVEDKADKHDHHDKKD